MSKGIGYRLITPNAVDALLAGAAESSTVRRAAAAAANTATFHATVEERLKSLEANLSEVKLRLNGLLFLAAGTVLTQLLLRLIHP